MYIIFLYRFFFFSKWLPIALRLQSHFPQFFFCNCLVICISLSQHCCLYVCFDQYFPCHVIGFPEIPSNTWSCIHIQRKVIQRIIVVGGQDFQWTASTWNKQDILLRLLNARIQTLYSGVLNLPFLSPYNLFQFCFVVSILKGSHTLFYQGLKWLYLLFFSSRVWESIGILASFCLNLQRVSLFSSPFLTLSFC